MKEMPHTFVGFKIRKNLHVTSKLVTSFTVVLISTEQRSDRDRYKVSDQPKTASYGSHTFSVMQKIAKYDSCSQEGCRSS